MINVDFVQCNNIGELTYTEKANAVSHYPFVSLSMMAVGDNKGIQIYESNSLLTEATIGNENIALQLIFDFLSFTSIAVSEVVPFNIVGGDNKIDEISNILSNTLMDERSGVIRSFISIINKNYENHLKITAIYDESKVYFDDDFDTKQSLISKYSRMYFIVSLDNVTDNVKKLDDASNSDSSSIIIDFLDEQSQED